MNFSKIMSIDEAGRDPTRWSRELDEMFEEAREFLQSFSWCGGVREANLGIKSSKVTTLTSESNLYDVAFRVAEPAHTAFDIQGTEALGSRIR